MKEQAAQNRRLRKPPFCNRLPTLSGRRRTRQEQPAAHPWRPGQPRQLRSGTVGHNAFRTDFGMAFGGFKQSGIGREGGREGLLPFLETKTVILEGRPAGYESPAQ
jgi:Aldehyde dehydrogenase family